MHWRSNSKTSTDRARSASGSSPQAFPSQARLLVLAISDPDATLGTADLARRLAPDVRIIARTNFIGEVARLKDLGVQEIVPQELETAIEILVRVLRHYLVPAIEVDDAVRRVRDSVDLPDRARPTEDDAHRVADYLPGVTFEGFRVEPGSEISGLSLLDSDLRRLSSCSVVAVKRGGVTDISIRPDTVLETGDIAVLLGPSHKIREAEYLFRAPERVMEDGSTISVDEVPGLTEIEQSIDADS